MKLLCLLDFFEYSMLHIAELVLLHIKPGDQKLHGLLLMLHVVGPKTQITQATLRALVNALLNDGHGRCYDAL